MFLLIADTSGRNGSVALARAEERGSDEVVLVDSAPLAGGTFSAQLVPQIADLLRKHGLSKSAIDAFIVVSGPGSFTGLRVGLAAIKALAEILQKPIVPVSVLELVARAAGTQGRVMAVLDAGRGEVYTAEYEFRTEAVDLVREEVILRADLAMTDRALTLSTPDASLAALCREAGLSVFELAAITPGMIATLGWKKLRAGETVSPERLEANYSRRSDSELFTKPASRA
ncbi:MAG TPA: tRNA (adenosine(37)-N6)-threonylcarbamoyltransferase complex dimerization subunit type 1 TsaB [Candidatus Sulfotelmatobacter sp.]|nr:tRNA (adenosine(37)-N6)-threonylcarbamoyltransferase complex dimerization subunit type 1 TsaB [Candidatus Sulfotelmatobacter sp.]